MSGNDWEAWKPNRPRLTLIAGDPEPEPEDRGELRRSAMFVVVMSALIAVAPLVAELLASFGARWVLVPLTVVAIGWGIVEAGRL